MIRINLIGKRIKAKSRAPKGQLYVFAAIILVELVFIFVWYNNANNTLKYLENQVRVERLKVKKLKKNKELWDKWQKEKAAIKNQMKVLEKLRYGQVGPSRLLRYFSYRLTKLPATPNNLDELKAQELAEWDTRWNTKRVWLNSIIVQNGKAKINGTAINHGDVAEFYKRLESCAYIVNFQPGLQKKSKRLNNTKLILGFTPVQFDATFNVKYDVPLMLDKQFIQAEKE